MGRDREARPGRMWDSEGFEDINSHSGGERPRRDPLAGWDESLTGRRGGGRPRSSARERPASRQARGREREPARQRAGGRERGRAPERGARRPSAQSRQRPAARPARRPGGRDAPRPRGRPEPRERKRRKPMSLFRRRLIIVLAVLVMVAGTLFLAESLLLRVTDVRVTGDAVYAEEDILNICGYNTGDNLLLVSTADREEKLETQLPYVAQAEISKRIPGTVVVEITAARPVCCLQAGGGWYVIDSGAKVLEARAEPYPGIMQVTGLNPHSAQPGYQLGLEDEAVAGIFGEILEAIDGLGAAELFTRLDLTDTNHIRLWYQDRVEFLLGGAVELAHKLQYGCGLFDTSKADAIQPEETGQLDLSYLPDSKAAYFSAGEVSPDQPVQAVPTPGAAQPGDNQGAEPEEGQQEPEEESGQEEGRGGGIPDEVFTG